MVTIQDVAKAAGVSPMTVSNVINRQPHVREETRERVLEIMRRLDYRVNVAARNLRTGRTGTIGLAVPEIDRPYYGTLAAHIIVAAREHRLSVAIEQTGATRESELDAVALSRNRLYDGLILSTVGLGAADTELLQVDYPVVLLGERIFDGPVDHVAMPNVAGARAAVDHLVAQGCTRIAILGGTPPDSANDVNVSTLRHRGYHEALQAGGLAYATDLVVTLDQFTMAGGADAIERLVRRGVPFDGVFCITDTIAMGALRAFHSLGIAVPEKVKVVGFDNVPESEYLVPSLTSVDPDHALMARSAVKLLVGRISGVHQAGSALEVTSPFRIVERESSATGL